MRRKTTAPPGLASSGGGVGGGDASLAEQQTQTGLLTTIDAYWSYDKNSSGNMANQRLQVDNSDEPAGQTTAVYDYRAGIDGTDEEPMMMTAMVTNMTAAAHTIDVDGSVDVTTSTPEAETRALWAVTMELASAGGGSSPARKSMRGFGR